MEIPILLVKIALIPWVVLPLVGKKNEKLPVS